MYVGSTASIKTPSNRKCIFVSITTLSIIFYQNTDTTSINSIGHNLHRLINNTSLLSENELINQLTHPSPPKLNNCSSAISNFHASTLCTTGTGNFP